MDENKGARILEKVHTIAILQYLYEHGQCRKIDLYKDVSTDPTVQVRLNELEENGLIRTDTDRSRRAAVVISLTARGIQVAELLADIDSILKG